MKFRVALALGLFGMILGAKWAMVALYSTELPLWDQWDAEARMLLEPWFDRGFGDFMTALFHPQNEHRVVWTKLLALGEVLLNGQWDARLQSVVNATLAAALGAGGWFWLSGIAKNPAARAGLFVVVLGLTAPPLSWQNLIGGFHSQQVLLIGFSLVAIALAVGSATGSRQWWVGAGFAAAAFFTMGSGFFAAAVILVAAAWGACLIHRWREERLALIAVTLVVAAGVFLRVDAGQHEPLKAQGIRDFAMTFWRSLQWPVLGFVPYPLIAWAPWGLLAWDLVRRREAAPKPELALAAMGGWTLLQFLATAYARGAGGDWPASRYLDTVATGLITNAGALAILLCRPESGRRVTRALSVLAVAWVVPIAFALTFHVREAFTELKVQKVGQEIGEAATHAYLVAGDPALLRNAPFVPYPDANDFMDRISPASIRHILPSSVRLEIPVASSRSANFSVGPIGPIEEPHPGVTSPATPGLGWRRHWGSFGPAGAASTGEWSSEPLDPPGAGWLKFETSGDIGEPGVRLELRSANDNTLLEVIQPSRIPHDTWRAAYVRAPRVRYQIVASDTDSGKWLAFSAPVEMASLSHFAWRASANGTLIFWISGALASLFTLAAFLGRKSMAR